MRNPPESANLGTILRRQRVGPFRVVEKSFLPATTLAMHEHERAHVSLTLAGGYQEICQKEERTCVSGTVMWHPVAETHADHFHATGGITVDLEIGLEGNWLDNAVQELHLVPRISTFRHGVPYSLGLRLYRALDQGPQVIENAATELVSYFFSGAQDRQPPAWLRRVLEMAEAKEGQPLSLRYVAREVGVHPVHVARSFRHFFGCSFGDYLTKLRVRKASELLLIRRHTMAEVAHICGFADHAHLCRTFKRLTGLTPSGFRSKVQLPKIRPENSLLQVNPAQDFGRMSLLMMVSDKSRRVSESNLATP